MTAEIEKRVNGMMLKDLRIELRSRGLNPGGSQEDLKERLIEAMVSGGSAPAAEAAQDTSCGVTNNNYARSGGQNTGNFLTDRPSSRVLAAPGGASQISFGDYQEPAAPAPKAVAQSGARPDENTNANVGPTARNGGIGQIGHDPVENNYSRPGGQNVGNFITDRPSSRVLAPSGGGASQITFG